MNTDVFGSVTAGCCRCTIDCRDQLLSVRLSGEIDQAGAAVLREKIDQAAESCLPQTLMQMGGLDKLPIFGGSVRPEKA